jgi:hypothetical protein
MAVRREHPSQEGGLPAEVRDWPVRDFTAAEEQRLRELTAQPMPLSQEGIAVKAELEAIHEAAGRIRGSGMWELDGGRHDSEAAYAEELRESIPWFKCWAGRYLYARHRGVELRGGVLLPSETAPARARSTLERAYAEELSGGLLPPESRL